jgi:hypothetical protein
VSLGFPPDATSARLISPNAIVILVSIVISYSVHDTAQCKHHRHHPGQLSSSRRLLRSSTASRAASSTRRSSCTSPTTRRWGSSSTTSTARSLLARVHTLRQDTHIDPHFHQRRHRLHVLIIEQVEDTPDVDEVHEAGIEFPVGVAVPEGEPVLPVKMGVAAEHLLVHVLDLCLEALGEARGLANPVVWISLDLGRAWEWWSGSEVVGREEALVLDLAGNPGLDVLDIGRSWEVDWVALGVDPGVGGPIMQLVRFDPNSMMLL